MTENNSTSSIEPSSSTTTISNSNTDDSLTNISNHDRVLPVGYKKRVMRRINETTPVEPPPSTSTANWLSGEERSRLEAVQRDWRLSRPTKVYD